MKNNQSPPEIEDLPAIDPRIVLARAYGLLSAIEDWKVVAIAHALPRISPEFGIGMGKVAQPLRVAITGTPISPDIAHTIYLTGKAKALARIDAALAMIPSST